MVQRNEEQRLCKDQMSLRRHLKQSMAIDTSNQMILAVRYRYAPTTTPRIAYDSRRAQL